MSRVRKSWAGLWLRVLMDGQEKVRSLHAYFASALLVCEGTFQSQRRVTASIKSSDLKHILECRFIQFSNELVDHCKWSLRNGEEKTEQAGGKQRTWSLYKEGRVCRVESMRTQRQGKAIPLKRWLCGRNHSSSQQLALWFLH